MKILYLIPARKGSKGLPGKNTKKLGSKPLIAYSIDFALLNKKDEDELCITTNDPAVIEVANSMGVTIPFIRPDELSNDTASSYDVMLHALNYYEEAGKIFDTVLLLQPTSPFRTQDDFISLINQFDEDTEMVVSVKLAKENPYFTLFEESKDGLLQKCKEGKFERRQDCPRIYAFNGSMYLINAKSIKKLKINEFKRIKKILMPEERSIDIDIMADFILAEYYLSKL